MSVWRSSDGQSNAPFEKGRWRRRRRKRKEEEEEWVARRRMLCIHVVAGGPPTPSHFSNQLLLYAHWPKAENILTATGEESNGLGDFD